MAFGKLNLDDFHISRTTGFLIENPLELLPKPFHIWQEMAIRMPELVAAKRIRQCVDEMPLLDHTALTGYRERRLAHLLLMALGTGYVWQDGDRGVPQGLPESLAMPWWGLSRDLGLTPSVNHAALVLANWKFLNAARPFSLDNIDWLCPFPGGDSAKWFVLITTQMERVFVKGLLSIESAIGWVCACDVQGLTGCLREVQQVIRALKSTLSQMQERVNPEVFYSQLRPFLAGWGGEGSPLPKGLIYTGVSNVPQQFTGGSAAQSSIFQTLDAFLGVEHTHSQRDFLLGMRQYMPPDHRRFIETLEAGRLVRDFVLSSSDEELTKAYSECVDSLIDFRSYHIQVVTKYVVIMSQKSERNKDYDSVSKMGTGGSSLVPFLKAIRSTTEDARLPKKQ